MRATLRGLVVLISSLALPTLASAQASIVGTVKDASGAVLPGVTVEASSPVLIEKVRSAVTDGSGQYPHCRSAAWPLRGEFLPPGLHHHAARGDRAGRNVHGNGQRRPAGWRRVRDHHRQRRIAHCRSAERQQADGDAEGRHRRHPRRAQPPKPGHHDSGALDQHRHQRTDTGRGRHQQPSARQCLHHPRRAHHGLEHPARWIPGAKHRLVRQPHQHVSGHGGDAGDDHRLRRRAGRSAHRGCASQLRAQGGRQRLQVLVLRHRREPVVPGEQLLGGAQGSRPDDAELSQEGVRRERLGRWPDRA